MLAGKRHRGKKKVPEITVASLDVSEAEKEVPANPGESYDQEVTLKFTVIHTDNIGLSSTCRGFGRVNKIVWIVLF